MDMIFEQVPGQDPSEFLAQLEGENGEWVEAPDYVIELVQDGYSVSMYGDAVYVGGQSDA